MANYRPLGAGHGTHDGPGAFEVTFPLTNEMEGWVMKSAAVDESGYFLTLRMERLVTARSDFDPGMDYIYEEDPAPSPDPDLPPIVQHPDCQARIEHGPHPLLGPGGNKPGSICPGSRA